MKKKLIKEYKKIFSKKEYKISILYSIILLLIAAIMSYFSIQYVEIVKGVFVSDLLLDNLPQLNLFWFRTIGISLIVFFIIWFGISNPKKLPFLSKSIALMYIIRALFLPLTHLKFYPTKMPIPKEYLFYSTTTPGNDLFFSGHVSLPFIVALIFWDHKKIRYFFLSCAILSGIAMILSKAHYSIDIFAAPFITYSIFKIAQKLFKKDLKFFKN